MMREECRNGPDEYRWTCPKCYTDHDGEVTACEGCGVALKCYTEQVTLAVCAVRDPNEVDDDEDDECGEIRYF